jgi:hypothetical protein
LAGLPWNQHLFAGPWVKPPVNAYYFLFQNEEEKIAENRPYLRWTTQLQG